MTNGGKMSVPQIQYIGGRVPVPPTNGVTVPVPPVLMAETNAQK
jgi:hypothetical protein